MRNEIFIFYETKCILKCYLSELIIFSGSCRTVSLIWLQVLVLETEMLMAALFEF